MNCWKTPGNTRNLWDNRNGSAGAGNTIRTLTHESLLPIGGLPIMVPKKPRVSRISLVCQECGIGFEKLPCQLGRGRGKYCSRICGNAAMSRGDEKNCTACGEPFYKQNAEMDSEDHFCTKACYLEWRDLNRAGDTYKRVGQEHLHRVVAKQVLGRELRPAEVVHHMDEIKLNNAVENLAVFPNQSYHARWHSGGMSIEELAGYTLTNGAPKL